MKRRWHFYLSAVLLAGISGILVYSLLKPRERRYCWLVFGPEAHVRVLVCLEGEAISFTHFVDDNFTGRTEWFRDRTQCSNVTFADPDGENCYVVTRVVPRLVHVDIKGPVEYQQYADIGEMGQDSETAPIAHFHGPLTVGAATISWSLPPNLALQKGGRLTDLQALVGTFDAAKRCWVVVRSESLFSRPEERRPTFAQGVHPFVDVDFPPKNQSGPPIKRRYALDKFC